MIFRTILPLLLVIFSCSNLTANQSATIIYRGVAPGAYSLPSLMLKVLQKPDMIELPLLLSKDNIPVVYTDIFLHTQTNVADIFPGRNRQDGNFYLIDFTMAEIAQLSYRINSEALKATMHPASLADSVEVISAISSHQGSTSQIIPVIKYPWFHTNEGKDISSAILETLISLAGSPETPLFLKCYDPDELQRIKKNILPGLPVEIKLIQGIDFEEGRETMRNKRGSWYSYSYDWVFTRLGMRVLAGYAEGLSFKGTTITDDQTMSRLTTDSQGFKMKVYIGFDDAQLENPDKLFDYYLTSLGIDGIALSQPGLLKKYLGESQVFNPAESFSDSVPAQPSTSTTILSDPEELSRRLQTLE